MGQLFAYYESVLHSVREGLLLVDQRGSMVLYNDHAALLLDMNPTPAQKDTPPSLASLKLPESLTELLRTGRTATDEVHLAGDRLLVVSQRPALVPGSTEPAGTVATLLECSEFAKANASLGRPNSMSEMMACSRLACSWVCDRSASTSVWVLLRLPARAVSSV